MSNACTKHEVIFFFFFFFFFAVSNLCLTLVAFDDGHYLSFDYLLQLRG